MKKDWQQVIKRLRKEGLIVELRYSTKHLVATLPNGQTTTLMRTPSDYRGMKNAESDIRRLAKL